MTDLPHEIQVWRSTDTLDHIGTWATTRFPAEAVTYVPKADAQAAVALTEAVNKARDPGRQPDYCYDEEWEYTMPWDQWSDLVEYHDLTEPVPVYTLYKGPTKWAVNVPNSWDEDGTPDGWDVEIFDSETAARAAAAAHRKDEEPK